jgi:hypothetical protein
MRATELAQRLAEHAEDVARMLLPNGRRMGHEWRVGGVDGNEGQSLGVHLDGEKAGVWSDFGTDDGGDLIGLWMATRSLPLRDACNEAMAYLGLRQEDAPRRTKTYQRPEPKQGITALSSGHAAWLRDARKIPDATVAAYRVKTRNGAIMFPYLRDGHLIAAKYRKLPKRFHQDPDCEPCLFGWQVVEPIARSVIICEGELDAMAWHAYGFPALSVPMGGGKAGKQGWIENEYDRLEAFDVIYVSMDNDSPGREGMRDICQRLGRERCRVVVLPLKDANACLIDGVSVSDMASALNDARSLPDPPVSRVLLVDGSSVPPTSVDWLWPGFLACGKLALLCGAAGTGKTTLALHIAATVTTGGRWPDGQLASAGRVVIWSGEDEIADTLVPRLLAAGADMSRVKFIAGMVDEGVRVTFDPARDVPQLAAALSMVGDVRLLLVDPIVSAIAGDSHKNAEVRRGLQPLVDLGMQCGAAILGITHFSKGTAGRDPLERVTGSLAFGAFARLVMVTVHQRASDENPVERRMMLRAKSNIGVDGGGFEYSLEQRPLPGRTDIQASVACWGSPVDGYTRDLIAAAEAPTVSRDSAEADALEFLNVQLAAGPKLRNELMAEAKEAGVAWRTVERAKANSGGRIKWRRRPSDGKSEWFRMAAVVLSFPKPVDQGRQVRQLNQGEGVGGLDGVTPDDHGEDLL